MACFKNYRLPRNFNPSFTAYTDGGYVIPIGIGASACIIIDKNNEIIHTWSKASRNSTNNRQELAAIIHAVLHTPMNSDVLIISDSKYAMGVLSGCNNAKTNQDLIAYYCKFVLERNIRVGFKWVRGHNGDKWNEAVDAMCTEAIEENNPANKTFSKFYLDY